MATPSSLVTIGITAYNAQDSIEWAVCSALAQKWAHTEILIVDDASRDDTPGILRKIAQDHPHIRVFYNEENAGVALCRNLIIAEAKGEFIAFFDDDDESTPDRVEVQLERIYTSANPAQTLCHTARHQTYPDGARRIEPTMGAGADIPAGVDVAARILWGAKTPGTFGAVATCSQMGPTSLYRGLGGFDPAFRRSEDTEFAVRAAIAGAAFIGVSAPLVRQFMTRADDKKIAQEEIFFLKLLAKHEPFITRHVSYAACVSWVRARYDFIAGRRLSFMRRMMGLALRHPVFTLRRVLWALPNVGFSIRSSAFHRGEDA